MKLFKINIENRLIMRGKRKEKRGGRKLRTFSYVVIIVCPSITGKNKAKIMFMSAAYC
jgi:hypothetical protein